MTALGQKRGADCATEASGVTLTPDVLGAVRPLRLRCHKPTSGWWIEEHDSSPRDPGNMLASVLNEPCSVTRADRNLLMMGRREFITLLGGAARGGMAARRPRA